MARLKQRFTSYIEHLNINIFEINHEKLDKIQNKSIKETAWLQLLVTMKFWLDDTSSEFEKTDLFIEKSVKASFDFIDTTSFKSLIDLGKFLYTEKMHANYMKTIDSIPITKISRASKLASTGAKVGVNYL